MRSSKVFDSKDSTKLLRLMTTLKQLGNLKMKILQKLKYKDL